MYGDPLSLGLGHGDLLWDVVIGLGNHHARGLGLYHIVRK